MPTRLKQFVCTVGIVFSAVTVLIVALIALCIGVLSIGSVFFPRMTYFWQVQTTIALTGLGGWGIASVVGIVKARKWARISMLAFGVILLAIAVFGTANVVFDPTVGVLYLMEGVYQGSIRVEMLEFFASLAALGGFWLFFFNRDSVKTRFLR